MKIAIVAPSPTPFVVGGAEKLWWGMQRYLNEETTHACELFKVPVQERSVPELLQAYHRFFTLDLSRFDRVISTKYPAFMVRHPDHHLYLQHLLRGCYDTYPAHLPEEVPWADDDLQHLIAAISRPDIGTADIFAELFACLDRKSGDPEVHRFPGPFIRKVLRILDRRGMEGVRHFSAISQTVRDRKDYFPPAATVEVIHHPSNLTGYRTGTRRHLFTASRLDAPKRIDLLIRAVIKSRVDLPFLIAGTGPQEEQLKKLAAGDRRIRFLGFVSDRELVEHYADAAAVLYAPYDEDYGLITVEAFGSGKPVVTCTDSGGVTELVVDGENGFVASPDADSLARAIETAVELPEETVAGRCRATVADIRWDRLMGHLLDEERPAAPGRAAAGPRRKHALVVSTYPVFPPVSGGQLRLYHMLRRLSCRHDISLLSLGGRRPKQQVVTPHFTEYVIPETEPFTLHKRDIEQRLGISAGDLTFMCHDAAVPAYEGRFRELAPTADLVICAHPYAYPLVRRHYSGCLVYDAHNMEYLLKSRMVKCRDDQLLQELFAVERDLCRAAELTIACAEEDIRDFQETYGLSDFRVCLLPNGIDAGNTPFLTSAERRACKRRLGINGDVAIFIGSGHQPNVDAVQELLRIAGELPEVRFVVIGSVAAAFPPATADTDPAAPALPANVGFTGVISDQEKAEWLRVADIALNPMRIGSGSNLKLAEYLAAGIPVVSTPVGARGYRLEAAAVMDVVEVADFAGQVAARLASREETTLMRAREHILAGYDWDVIMSGYPL